MGVMNRNQFAKELQEGLNTVFGLDYKRYPEEWKGLFDTETSRKAFEEDQLVTGFGTAAVKPEGAPMVTDSAQEGWTARYTMQTVALAFAITQEAIEDNLYMSMGKKYSRALARAMQETKEIKAADVYNRAYDSNYAGGDGKSLLAADHPLVGGGSYSNKLAVDADFSEAALEEILIQMRKNVDDRGIPLALKSKSIIIPPDLEYIAHRVLRTNLRPGTADNDANAIKDKSIFSADPKIITRLSDPDAWFIRTDVADGMKHFNRKSLSTNTDNEFTTGNYRYSARERYTFGFTDPRAVFGSK